MLRSRAIDVRPQFMSGNARDALNVQNPLGRNAAPLRDCAMRDAQLSRKANARPALAFEEGDELVHEVLIAPLAFGRKRNDSGTGWNVTHGSAQCTNG